MWGALTPCCLLLLSPSPVCCKSESLELFASSSPDHVHLCPGHLPNSTPTLTAATLQTTRTRSRAGTPCFGMWPSQEEIDQPGGKPQVIQNIHHEVNPFLLSAVKRSHRGKSLSSQGLPHPLVIMPCLSYSEHVRARRGAHYLQV